MALNSNALLSVQQYLDFTGQTRVLSDAFTIYNNSGSNTSATVAVTDTTLVTVGSGTGTDTFTFANAAHDTMAELTAAITALGEGWQVELLSGGTVATGNLVPFPATDAFGQDSTLTLQYSNTSYIEDLINAASQAIETYLGTIVVAQTDIREWVDGRGDCDLLLKNIPVTAVKRVAYGSEQSFYVQNTLSTDLRATVEVQDSQIVLSRVASDGTETASSLTFASNATASALVTAINLLTGWSATLVRNWPSVDLHRLAGMDARGLNVDITFPETSASVRHVDEAAGLVTLAYGYDGFGERAVHWGGRYGYLVQYNAGYALASVPSDIVTACWKLAQKLQQAQGQDQSLQSESLGQYSYTRANVTEQAASALIDGDIASLLRKYSRDGSRF